MPTKIGIGPLKKAKTRTEAEAATAQFLQRSLEITDPESLPENEGQLSVDVCQTHDSLIITAPIAGVTATDIDITVNADTITIRGKRSQPENTHPENFLTQECFWGNFSRTIILPQDVDTKKIRANFKKGILIIRIPRTQSRNGQTIKIQT
ncbi:Hsp20/alpha crystallin family protein [Candidatus Peregrinibacteria bacterium]|nr:Hsp20/alpha crystallin family protein [Candidatus Peregrinibacteria bacterium]